MQRLQALTKELNRRITATDGRGLEDARVAELRGRIAELIREDEEDNAQGAIDLDIGPPPSYDAGTR